tara:strand:+ start:2131 stop:3366 length:1236 start_codon:yes stop_codon:yes gene_type:complete
MKHIINKTDYTREVDSLTNFAQKRMGFSKVPRILFDDDVPNSHKTLGKTGYYNPANSEIHIYASGRHIKDILRSLAHEFVHHMQNEKGDLTNDGYMGQGYAQKNPKMREMERQAYEMGNLCFRDWEDSLKQKHPTIYNERRNRKMSLKDWKNKELNENLNKRWGFSMNLDALNENKKKEYDLEENQDRIFAPSHYCMHHVIHEGKKGYTVDHNYNERLGKVTRYDVKFEDGSIKRNIHESELTALEAFSEGEHKRDDHPPAKRDKDENKNMPKDRIRRDIEGDGQKLPKDKDGEIDWNKADEMAADIRMKKPETRLAKENVEENLDNLKGGLKDYMKNKSSKKDDDDDNEDSSDKEEKEDEKSSDEEKPKDGKMPMKTDTKDADNDGDTTDKVPAFVKESLSRKIRVNIKR